jgi:hypothetical protein
MGFAVYTHVVVGTKPVGASLLANGIPTVLKSYSSPFWTQCLSNRPIFAVRLNP